MPSFPEFDGFVILGASSPRDVAVPITPAELRDMKFDLRRRGYDTEAVDTVMQTVAMQLARTLNERENLQATLDDELRRIKGLEQRLAKTLLVAEATATQMIENANAEASEIVKEARASADAILEDGRRERDELAEEIERLQTLRKETATDYRALLLSALDLVDDADEEPAESERGPDADDRGERSRSAWDAAS